MYAISKNKLFKCYNLKQKGGKSNLLILLELMTKLCYGFFVVSTYKCKIGTSMLNTSLNNNLNYLDRFIV